MLLEEHLLVTDSLQRIREIRASKPLPDTPVVIFSATTGRAGRRTRNVDRRCMPSSPP
jgi:hypothetical protein